MKRIGVIGGGQLAWMMAGAAQKLGIELVVQTPHPTDPAGAFVAKTIFAPIDDAVATAQLATECDVITFENEFVNLQALLPLVQQGVCFRPGLDTLSPLLDKYHQRCYLQQLGLPIPKFIALKDSNPEFDFPAVLKARRHGYDGQGTFIIKDLVQLQDKLNTAVGQSDNSVFLLEEFVPFERELAIIAARSVNGEIVTYPIVETQQVEQVCRRVLIPAEITSHIQAKIEAIARTLLNSLQAVGVFGIELFLTSDGQVLVNEIAPRTHNSGHFTIDACQTSQFEQHLRAVAGLSLGKVDCAKSAVMVNLLGYEYAQNDYLVKRQQLASVPQAHIHWYGKTESRPGRKLGHVTVLLDAQTTALSVAQTIESIWYAR